MYRQIDIFSFVEDPGESVDFKDMSTEEIARYIGERVGLKFVYNADCEAYETRINKYRFSVSKSSYTCKDKEGVEFISCGAQKMFGDWQGCGSPEDSLRGAVKFFETWKNRFLGGGNND